MITTITKPEFPYAVTVYRTQCNSYMHEVIQSCNLSISLSLKLCVSLPVPIADNV